MSSVLRSVRKRKKGRTLGAVDVIDREGYAELEVETKVELIRSLIPLGLMHIEELLNEEVTALAGERDARKDPSVGGRRHGSNPGTVGLAGQRVPIRVPRIRHVTEREIPLRSYEALHGDRAVNDLLLRRVLYGISCRNEALVHGSRALGAPRSTSWPSWRQQVHDLDMKSSVHPQYKTKYHVGNWPAYDRALVQRGDITVWLAPDAIAAWEAVGVGNRGGQRQYSDLAIETALTLRLIFHLPLRQTEGFLTSIFGMLGLDLSAPDHTTLSRRGQHLDLPLRRAPTGAGLHLIVDSTGLSIVGEGEWAAAKHGGRGRRGWKKLHFGVDRSGVIVARALTEASVDDATTGITLIEATDGALGQVTADAAYDTIGFYEAAGARGATVVVPPTRTAHVSRHGPRSSARDRTILAVKERGRRRWKQTSGYHGQARVENAFFRYKSIIGDSLRACSPAGRGTEVDLACNILNQMTGLGRPMSYRIGR